MKLCTHGDLGNAQIWWVRGGCGWGWGGGGGGGDCVVSRMIFLQICMNDKKKSFKLS